jgi:hypothetical protein
MAVNALFSSAAAWEASACAKVVMAKTTQAKKHADIVPVMGWG